MKKITLSILSIVLFTCFSIAQTDTLKNKKDGHYYFIKVKDIEALDVQSQGRTGTCWSFSSLSFLESEIIRKGKKPVLLSEMFVVRNAYYEKAVRYVRMHGSTNFSAGGAFHDIPFIVKKYGIVPEQVYAGLNYGEEKHNHAELDAILKAAVDEVVKNPQKKLTSAWKTAIEGILDAYFGKIPNEFEYQGKKYTPKTYSESLGLNMDDYVSIGSFMHHPFYKTFVLEVPDNWLSENIYNVPLNEMEQLINDAVMNGYSVAWGSDVSEKGFSFKNGLAIVPEDEATITVAGKDNKHFSDAGAEKISNAFDEPVKEKQITQEMRQEAFDNYETQDDHGMHITGIVKDQKGTKYYIVKNSWGKDNFASGYFYASETYLKYKTIDFMVHKDALSSEMKKKLGIK